MATDEWWNIIETRYGPHDYECCANNNGDNARKTDFFSPSRSFLSEFPEPGSNGFLNPEYSRAQEFLNRARRIHDDTHGRRQSWIQLPPLASNAAGFQRLAERRSREHCTDVDLRGLYYNYAAYTTHMLHICFIFARWLQRRGRRLCVEFWREMHILPLTP